LAKEECPELKIIIKHGHNLFDPEEVIKKGNDGKVITTLNGWKKVSRWRKISLAMSLLCR